MGSVVASRSTTERTVKTKFDGDASGGVRASKEMERELRRLQRESERAQADFVSKTTRGADRVTAALASTTKGILAVGSAAGSAQGLAGATAAVATMSGVVLALPGLMAAGAAGAGVLQLALSGMSDAIAADDLEEFNELTKNMGAGAVETARAVRDQRDRLTELRKLVQNNFFADFDDDVRALSDRYFPELRRHTGAIAGEFNKMGREGAKALLEPGAVDDVNVVLDETRKGLKELRPALGNTVSGFLNLSAVGATRLPALARGVNNVTQAFEDWVDEGVQTGRINDLIDEGIDTARQFGHVLKNITEIGGTLWRSLTSGEQDFLDGMIESTQAIEDFLESAEGQEALKTLAETLGVAADVARNVFGTAMRELAPIVTEAGPAVQEAARALGDFLVTALQTVGPLLRDVAEFLSENKEVVGDLVPLVLALAVGYKGLKAAQEAAVWVGGLATVLGDFDKKAKGAGDAVGDVKGGRGLAGRLSGLVGLAGGAAALGFAIGAVVDKLNDAEAAQRVKFVITVGANTKDAEIETRRLADYINKTSGTVNINGNDEPASVALAEVMKAINAGKGTVTLNGNEAPAVAALDYLVSIIDSESGTVDFNGDPRPAGQVLAHLLENANASGATIKVGANTLAAQGVIDSFIRMNDGRTVQIYTSVLGSGGIASAGRLASGGRPFFNGRVTGPGTPTSDTAGLFALSDEEHVWSAADVAGAGGHGAMYRMRALARQGRLRGFADGGTPRFLTTSIAPPSRPQPVSVAAPNTNVAVYIDGQQFRGIIKTEIKEDKREAKRVARSGPGGAW